MDLRPALLVLAACSGKPRAIEEEKKPTQPVAASRDAAAIDAPRPAPTTGDLQIRVEWDQVPADVRASPGATPCGTPRAPQVEPTTTFGIPDVLVFVDGQAPPPAEAHVRLAGCALAPRVAIGAALVLDSAADRPAKLVVEEYRRADALDVPLEESTPERTAMLPIAGHAVAVPLDPGAVYTVATDAKPAETAVVVAAPGSITDASGVVLVKDLAPGEHAVRAWLPPRSGKPARKASGRVTVVAGDLVELTLQLVP